MQQTQYAVQLISSDQLCLNTSKPIHLPQNGNHIPAQVLAVGLCYSDMKLLHQFGAHPRKSPILGELGEALSQDYPAYVPGDKLTVPGHEICALMDGQIVLLQADYRHAKTDSSNGALGYNVEGGLQEWMLLDKRLLVDNSGVEYFLVCSPNLSYAAVALTEPWACVEASYMSEERATVKEGGRFLLVSEFGQYNLCNIFSVANPAELFAIDLGKGIIGLPADPQQINLDSSLLFDDIIYVGRNRETIEALEKKLANNGILNIVNNGSDIGSVLIDVGSIHYRGIRIFGTKSQYVVDGYKMVPDSTELAANANLLVIGAGERPNGADACFKSCNVKSSIQNGCN